MDRLFGKFLPADTLGRDWFNDVADATFWPEIEVHRAKASPPYRSAREPPLTAESESCYARPMRRRVTWLLVPLAWALACGGRYEQTVAGDGDAGSTSTGQGGSGQAKAGSASRAGSTGQAAATGRGGSMPSGSGAATASGGAPSGAGGFATGGTIVVGTAGTFVGTAGSPIGCACDPIACGSPYMLVPNADGCCYHCELDIKACQAQRAAYVTYRQQLLDKYGSNMCGSNAECTMYFEKNACGTTSCGFPIAKAMWASLDSNLNSYAQMACSPYCPTAPEPPCDPSPGPECFKGYCN